MTADAAVRHADAAGVDDESAVDEAYERHMSVAAHDGAYVIGEVGECLGPTFHPGVDEHDLFVVAGCSVAEGDVAEAGDRHGDRMRQ